jgi:tetratricopeptide (TPR) repeat protein
MLAVLPELDLVVVNRADTYTGEGTPTGPLLDLLEAVIAARSGTPAAEPRLVPLAEAPADPRLTEVAPDRLAAFAGRFPDPPAPLGAPALGEVELRVEDGHLRLLNRNGERYTVHLQPDGTFFVEDRHQTLFPVHDPDGVFAGLANVDALASGVRASALAGQRARARELAGKLATLDGDRAELVDGLAGLLAGEAESAEAALRTLSGRRGARAVESDVNVAGYDLLRAGRTEAARAVFELNTRLFPAAFNTWDSLREVCLALGEADLALAHYQRSLELNPDNGNAREVIARLSER